MFVKKINLVGGCKYKVKQNLQYDNYLVFLFKTMSLIQKCPVSSKTELYQNAIRDPNLA